LINAAHPMKACFKTDPVRSAFDRLFLSQIYLIGGAPYGRLRLFATTRAEGPVLLQ
jgi:hypothetical protein